MSNKEIKEELTSDYQNILNNKNKLSTKEFEEDIVSDYQNILTMALRTDDPEKLIGMFLGSILFLTEFHIESDGEGIILTKKGIFDKGGKISK